MGRVDIEVVGGAGASVDTDDQWNGMIYNLVDMRDVRYT